MKNTRKVTNKVLDAIAEGTLDVQVVLAAALSYMSEDDVADMASVNCFFDYEEEDEEDDVVR